MKKGIMFLFFVLYSVIFLGAEVGVLVSEASENFYGPSSYQAILEGTLRSLEYGNIEYELLDTTIVNNVGIPDYIKVLILHDNASLTEREVSEIEAFLQRGGKILGGYEATLRYSDGKIRSNYIVGPYLGIQYSNWERGEYNYTRITEEGKKVFGEEMPDYIKMPRGFTFTFKTIDPEVKRLAEWSKDSEGNPSTSYEDNCAVVLGKSGIFFSENVFALALGDYIFQKLIANATRYLLDLPPTPIDEVEIELSKVENEIKEMRNEIERIRPNVTEERYFFLLNSINELEKRLKDVKIKESSMEEVSKLKEELSIVRSYTFPSDKIETRAVWLDYSAIAQAKTPQNLSKIINELADLNFNLLLPEIIYQGRTISKTLSETTGYPLSELFEEWEEDPLQIIISEAHKRGMEVHPWVWTFAIAHTSASPMMSLHPEWLEKNKFGNIYSESQTVWLSHSNQEARNFIKNAILVLVKEFDVDGIHLDYIRYASDYMGYDESTIKKFYEESGIDPFTIEKYSPEEVTWQLWRENLVTSFVHEIYREVKTIKPEIIVSAAIGPSLSESRLKYKQNWGNWAQNHYIDVLFPMDYKSSLEDLEIVLDEQKNYSRYVLIYPGLAAFSIRDQDEMMRQIGFVKEKGFPGVAIFSASHIKSLNPTMTKTIDLSILKTGYFREYAITAHAPSKVLFETFIEELEDTMAFLHENYFLTDEETKWLKAEIKNTLIWNEESIFNFWQQLSALKTEIASNITNYDASITLINEIYKMMDILRPILYAKERKEKAPIKATKPPEMVVVENLISLPKMQIQKVSTPPVIDGEVDNIWEEIEWSNNFLTNDSGEPFPFETKVKAFYDEKYLYVLFSCEEPDLSEMKIIEGPRDTRVYLGDSVEVFIRPDESDPSKYYHFVVSANGTIYDEIMLDSRWNGNIETATNKIKGKWVAELKIDLQEIGVDVSKITRVNFTRNRWKGDASLYGCWSCTYGSFHTPERFGYLEFL